MPETKPENFNCYYTTLFIIYFISLSVCTIWGYFSITLNDSFYPAAIVVLILTFLSFMFVVYEYIIQRKKLSIEAEIV